LSLVLTKQSQPSSFATSRFFIAVAHTNDSCAHSFGHQNSKMTQAAYST
jgi:hypothetical protein